MVTINVALGSGADTQATTGKIAIRPLAEHAVESGPRRFLALAAWEDHALDTEPIEWDLTAGELYEVREIEPRGKTRVFQAPTETTNYVDLVWLTEIPSSGGGYVVEPLVEHFAGASGEPDIPTGDYWLADNPAHPDFGYLMQKGS